MVALTQQPFTSGEIKKPLSTSNQIKSNYWPVKKNGSRRTTTRRCGPCGGESLRSVCKEKQMGCCGREATLPSGCK